MREFRLHGTESVCRKHVMQEFRLHGTDCHLQVARDASIQTASTGIRAGNM
jgi:hypothetical protein